MELPAEGAGLDRYAFVDNGIMSAEPVATAWGVVTFRRDDGSEGRRLLLRVEFAHGGLVLPIDVEHAESMVTQLQQVIGFARSGLITPPTLS